MVLSSWMLITFGVSGSMSTIAAASYTGVWLNVHTVTVNVTVAKRPRMSHRCFLNSFR